MRHFDILRTLTFLLLAYGIFSGNSCFKTSGNTEADSKCGEATVWKHTFVPLSFHDRGVGVDGFREFRYEDLSTPENICSEEHINVLFQANLKTEITKAPDSLSVRGYAYWSLFGRSTPLPVSFLGGVGNYEGNDQIGLKQAYPDGKGSVGLQIIVRFPTKGSLTNDEIYIDSLFHDFFISCSYRLAL